MAQVKTSVSFDEETKALMDRRLDQIGQSASGYLAQLVRRDAQEQQLAIDAQALRRAGLWGEDRLAAVNTAALRSRGV
jgi:uncharacterized protein YdbL (DUF1318 family)